MLLTFCVVVAGLSIISQVPAVRNKTRRAVHRDPGRAPTAPTDSGAGQGMGCLQYPSKQSRLGPLFNWKPL